MSSIPDYTETIDLETIVQGDSILEQTFTRLDDDGQPVVPLAVCANLVDSFGRCAHAWAAEIDAVSGSVTLPIIYDTKHLRAGVYKYGIQYSLANGQQRVFFAGEQVLVARRGSCT